MTLSTDTRQRIVAKATSIRVYIAVALVTTCCVAVLFNISVPDWFVGLASTAVYAYFTRPDRGEPK
jgi:hypothetical protein